MQRRLAMTAILAAALQLAGSPAARAESVVLGASQDNTLFEEDGGLSNGAGDHVFTGATKDAFARRALVAFDVAGAIPPGSTVNAVTLSLYMSRTRTQNELVALHRVIADWGEGTSHAGGEEGAGAPATAGDATWTHRLHPSTTWATPGGDFAVTASAVATVGNQTGYYAWSSAGMVSDVQSWVDGTQPPHGWILIADEINSRVAKRFDSRENADPNRRPMLFVDFTSPATTGACCAVDGSCSVVLDPGGACGGTYLGADTSCSPNPCPQPTGACCLPDASATCLEDTAAACTAQGGTYRGDSMSCGLANCPVVLTPFLDPLPRPAVAQPVSGASGGAASYTLAMRETQQQLHSQLAPTTVWGFDDGTGASYPGPTVEARVGAPVDVTWVNDLRDTAGGGALRTSHYFPVDPCPHGASQNADARTVVHLHGAHVASAFDGHPELTFPPGQQVLYSYPNWQLPGTLWYHDHALGITRLNVQMGLAGFWLIRDAFEEALGLPSGEFEIPLAIQDRSFNPDGSLEYPATWQDHVFGNTVLVNGKAWPYLDVKQGKYRFRLLNGSSSRTYRLSLSTGAFFQVIGMEGGLLPAPVPQSHITLGPGERADVVVDFAGYPAATEVLLLNDAPAPFPGDPGSGVVPNVMKFVVAAAAGHTAPLPVALRPMEVLQEGDATVHREFHLEKGPGDACSPFAWEIRSVVNGSIVGHKWVEVTEFPELDTTEVWNFVNRSGVTHPMHMHLVMFQVLDRQAFDDSTGQIVPIGSPVPPPPHEAGWKDTVQVGPNEIVRVIARFENYTGRYPYHCHILEHEDHEMMRQFQTGVSVPACQNGLDDDGDGLEDFAGGDPGCASADDFGERAPHLVCDDGIDNDGDGFTDFVADANSDGISDPPGDPGCRNPLYLFEQTQCQDGINNDGKFGTDFDGGVSILGPGGADPDGPDPQCVGQPWRNSEAAARRCGLGFEVAALLAPLGWLWGWSRRGRRFPSTRESSPMRNANTLRAE